MFPYCHLIKTQGHLSDHLVHLLRSHHSWTLRYTEFLSVIPLCFCPKHPSKYFHCLNFSSLTKKQYCLHPYQFHYYPIKKTGKNRHQKELIEKYQSFLETDFITLFPPLSHNWGAVVNQKTNGGAEGSGAIVECRNEVSTIYFNTVLH